MHRNEEIFSAESNGDKRCCSALTCTDCSALPQAEQGSGSMKPGHLAMPQQTSIRKKRGSSLQCPQSLKFLHRIMKGLYQSNKTASVFTLDHQQWRTFHHTSQVLQA